VSRFGPILAFNAESRIAEQTGHYVYALWFGSFRFSLFAFRFVWLRFSLSLSFC
jgi:hypothetical protein